jgi:hypothetical protein
MKIMLAKSKLRWIYLVIVSTEIGFLVGAIAIILVFNLKENDITEMTRYPFFWVLVSMLFAYQIKIFGGFIILRMEKLK